MSTTTIPEACHAPAWAGRHGKGSPSWLLFSFFAASRRLRRNLGYLLRLLVALAAPGTVAAEAADSIVPIEEEPRHRLMFENPHVRYFDVQLEPGYRSRWHTHLHDGVFINIATSETRAQDYGGEPASRPPRAIGETTFINYTKKPKAHRVTNTGTAPYRVVDTEIHRGCGGYRAIVQSPGEELLIDNDRVRVVRFMLQPGVSATLHPPCGMLVAVSSGAALLRSAGGDARLELQPANFQWRQSASAMELINVGSTVLHAVDVLVK